MTQPLSDKEIEEALKKAKENRKKNIRVPPYLPNQKQWVPDK